MLWPFLYRSEYLSLDRLARVSYKHNDCFSSDVVLRNSNHIFCTNPKIVHPSDFVVMILANHRFLSYQYSINIDIIVKGNCQQIINAYQKRAKTSVFQNFLWMENVDKVPAPEFRPSCPPCNRYSPFIPASNGSVSQ